jgi:hypothetical protein
MDTKEGEEMVSVFSTFMFNRKYKIHCGDKGVLPKQTTIPLKDYKFYNKRLLNFYKTLLLKRQCNQINVETDDFINKIPLDLTELGNKFIDESILFFKREDINELIQKDIGFDDTDNVVESSSPVELMENTNDIDMKFYHTKNADNSESMGTFQIVDEPTENNDFTKSLPIQKQYHLRDNTLRLKGITKNNNMSILYEEDEKTTI